MKKGFCLLAFLAFVLFFSPASGATLASVAGISEHGNLTLSISGTELLNEGYAYGDIISVTMGGKDYEMPIGTSFSDVSQGSVICRVKISPEENEDKVTLAMNMGDLATAAGIAVKETISEDAGYRWVPAEGEKDPIEVTITLKEKEGYLEEWLLLGLQRSNNREDYAELSDEEYANFRMVTTTGMGEGIMYRSSSPVNENINRNQEADKACQEAGIKTIVNLADSRIAMPFYEHLPETYYASTEYICLGLGFDYYSSPFMHNLAIGLRFMLKNEPPYLIHCMEGKDRTGFVCALLECLMGASADEVVEDYMITYYNFYGIGPDSEQYDRIADSNIKTSLADAFGVETIDDETVDLAAEAEEYLLEIGMSEEDIAALKTRLAQDYGGLAEAA